MLSFTADERADGLWRRTAGGPHCPPPPRLLLRDDGGVLVLSAGLKVHRLSTSATTEAEDSWAKTAARSGQEQPRVSDYDASWFISQDFSLCPTRKRSEMMRLLAMFEDHHGKKMVGLKGMSGITQVVCRHDQAPQETKPSGSFRQLAAFSGDTTAILGGAVSSVESLTAAGSWTVESDYQLVVAATRNRSQSVTPLKPSLYFATNRGCLCGCALSICWKLSFELDD